VTPAPQAVAALAAAGVGLLAALPAAAADAGLSAQEIIAAVYEANGGETWRRPQTLYLEGYGIFWPDYASDNVYIANDYQIATLTGWEIYDGDYIGDPGFMYENETESFLLSDLTFGFALSPFGDLFGGDLVYYEPVQEIDGDQNGDGFVGIADLNVVLGNWNAGTSPSAVVPEPASLVVLSLLGVSGLMRHRIK